jgi:hypothetical protein
MAGKKNKKSVKKVKKVYEELRDILFKSGLVLIAFFLVVGIYTLVDFERNGKYDNSYLITSKTISRDHIINVNNATDTFKNLNGDYFVYISYTHNTDVYNLEHNLKKIIDEYKLNDKFYYINVNDIKDNVNFKDQINAYLGYRDAKVSKVPTIVYVNSNNDVRIENIITRNDSSMMSAGDFQKLLDINEINK